MTPSLSEIDEAERPYLGGGEPVLGQSMALLKQRWAAGCRDRETSLRLLFLCWYGNIEPPFLTGLDNNLDCSALCLETFEALGGVETTDLEACFAVGLMAELGSWCLGKPEHWEQIGVVLRSRSTKLSPDQFAGRGAYGEYFRHMLEAAANKSFKPNPLRGSA